LTIDHSTWNRTRRTFLSQFTAHCPLPTVLCLLFFILAPLSAFAAAPSLEVNVSRDQIYLGESVLIEVKVGGADNPPPPDISALQNGKPELLGSQSSSHYSITIINGQMRREGFSGRTFTYKLTPVTEGRVVTGPITATVAGETLSATGPTVTVTGVTRQESVSIAVTASRDTVLVDEPFDIRLAVRIRRLPGRFSDTDPIFPNDPPRIESEFLNAKEIDGLKGPDYQHLLNDRLTPRNQPGFTINNYTVQADPFDFSAMMNPQGIPARFKLERRAVEEAGKAYWEYGVTVPYSPLAEGSYTFGPVLFKGNVPARVDGNGNASGVSIFAVGPAAIVRVVPPPEADRPDSYIGAIGSNLVVEGTLDAQTCNVGDPLTLTLSLEGSVQMRNITPPKLSLQTSLLEHFEVYDDTVQTLKHDPVRQYAYTLRPRHPGSFELPPVEVSYYDVTTRRYHTTRTRPIPLKVRQAAEITAAQVIGGSTNQAIRLHRDEESAMRPAGMRWETGGSIATPLLGPPFRLAVLAAIGPLLFCLSLFCVLLHRHWPAIRETRRRRTAFSRARAALKSTPPQDLCSVLRGYLSDRFTLKTNSMTPSEARSLLVSRGIPAPLAQHFSDLMQHHFNASFETSTAAGPVNTTELASSLATIEQALETVRKKSGARRLLILLTLLLAPLRGSASTPAERAFIWDEAMSDMSSAHTPKDFLDAAAVFQKLADRGIRNSTLFYNQGTALLLAGKPAEAIGVLLRAERYGGCTPDIRRNLAIAEAGKEGLKAPVDSWLRLVLFWHYGFACATRALLAAGAFSGLWLAWALGMLGARRTGKTVSLLCLILLAAFGSSVLATLQQESRVQRPTSFITSDNTSP